jgi:hypothetical protein
MQHHHQQQQLPLYDGGNPYGYGNPVSGTGVAPSNDGSYAYDDETNANFSGAQGPAVNGSAETRFSRDEGGDRDESVDAEVPRKAKARAATKRTPPVSKHGDVAFSDGGGKMPKYDNSRPAMPEAAPGSHRRRMSMHPRFRQQRSHEQKRPVSAFAFDSTVPMKPVRWHGWVEKQQQQRNRH